MKNLFRFVILWLLVSMSSLVPAESGIPLVHFQGTLSAADGTPQQGTKRLEFNLYDTADATAPIWGPQVFENVVPIEGRYGVILGTTDRVGRGLEGVTSTQGKFIGVTVDGQEIQPRQPILATAPGEPAKPSAPAPAGVAVPPGSIVAYWSERIPDGWLLCDGSLVPEGPQYDRLRALIGGNLPDLRGLFLRGIGQNSNPAFRYGGDASRTLGEFQQDELKTHVHRFDDFTFSANSGTGGNAWGSAGQSDIDNSPGSPYAHNTAAAGGDETRPKNAAVYWIVKY